MFLHVTHWTSLGSHSHSQDSKGTVNGWPICFRAGAQLLSNGSGRNHSLAQWRGILVQLNLKVKLRQAGYNIPRISSDQTRGLTSFVSVTLCQRFFFVLFYYFFKMSNSFHILSFKACSGLSHRHHSLAPPRCRCACGRSPSGAHCPLPPPHLPPDN